MSGPLAFREPPENRWVSITHERYLRAVCSSRPGTDSQAPPMLKAPLDHNGTPGEILSERLRAQSVGGRHPRGHHGTGKSNARLGLVSYTQAASPISRRRVAGSTAILRA